MPRMTLELGPPIGPVLAADEFVRKYLQYEIDEALEDGDWKTLTTRLQEQVRKYGIDIML